MLAILFIEVICCDPDTGRRILFSVSSEISVHFEKGVSKFLVKMIPDWRRGVPV